MKVGRPKRIYFFKPIGLDGPIKIGCSAVPARRMATYATWSPFPLELMGSIPGTAVDEQFLHGCFAESHSHCEWFNFTPALGTAIKSILAAQSVDAVRPHLVIRGSIHNKIQRPRWSAARRQWHSFAARLRNTERTLRLRLGHSGAWFAPDDVHEILHRWHKHTALDRPAADFARLEEYLSAPERYSVVPPWAPQLVADNPARAA